LLFIDTWGWLVLADGRDPDNRKAVQLRRDCTDSGGTLITTDYVLDETITRLYARRPYAEARSFCGSIFATRDAGILRIESVTPERFARSYELRLRFRDKPRISFTDLTSFTVMEELGTSRVMTADKHFAEVRLGFEIVP